MVGGCFIPARSTSLGVLQRAHLISSQGNPPLTAWSIVGDGSIGSPSLHSRSFQLSQSSLSACWIIASPLARVSADWAANALRLNNVSYAHENALPQVSYGRAGSSEFRLCFDPQDSCFCCTCVRN